jgi:hypothetical protein
MSEVTKASPVTIVYKHKENRIDIFGDGVQGSLYITGSEIKNMYWKGQAKGTVRITVEDE